MSETILYDRSMLAKLRDDSTPLSEKIMKCFRQGKKKAGVCIYHERVGAYVAREWRMRHSVSETRRPKIRITYVPKSAGGGGEEKKRHLGGRDSRETIDELLFNSAGVKTAIHNR